MRPAQVLPQTHEKIQERSTKKPLKKNAICNKKEIFMFTLTKCTDFSKHIDTKHNILIGWKAAYFMH